LETIVHPTPPPPASAREDRNRRIKAIVYSASGHVVEWYDFFVYSSLSLYFAGQFFPRGDQTSQLLSTMAVFAVGFFFRPLGGWFFGRVADRHGRRLAMLISVSLMSLGSFMVAATPTYASIGVWAGVLLLLSRVVQGISVGGEYGTVATYMSEVGLKGKRGFYSSWQYVTLIGGQLLAVVVLVIMQSVMPDENIRAWGWRIPFIIGGFAAIASAYARLQLIETTTAATRKSKEAGSLSGVWMHHRRAALVVLGFTAGGSLCYYTYATYMQQYLVNTTGFTAALASKIMSLALFVFMCAQPFFGALSDKIGRRNSMRIFGIGAAVATVPLLSGIGHASSGIMALVLVTLGLLIISPYTAISGIVKAELFPAEVRALGVGFPYAIGNALLGGTAPYVALWFKSKGHEPWFYYYVVSFCLIAFVVAMIMPDAREKGYLQGSSEVN
jgi:MFS transporter, MHS family, alpha-ketoglutarate permease